MLQGAVQKHGQESARRQQQQQRSLKNLFSSSPPEAAPARTGSQGGNLGHRHPLNPVAASKINSAPSWQQQRAASTAAGVKRTSSGLAKVLDGSFDDLLGSQQRPITVADGKSTNATVSTAFDENDFDSDIDLDVEEPVAKSTAAYPQLPKSGPASPVKPIVYPTLPRQQQAQSAISREAGMPEPGYDSMAPPSVALQKSSQPLPWSSSPTEHGPPSKPSLGRFAFGASDSAPPASTVSTQAKRRKLPWQTQSESQNDGAEPSTSITNNSRSYTHPGTAFTPLPKNSNKASYPWNTTASGMKAQQKQLREANKKKTFRENDATEESARKAKTARARPAKVFLSDEQQHVLDLVVEQKRSVFFTGSAGTGKSVLLREIIASLRKKYQREPDRVAVTASTGLAACNIGGVTLHSFAGIGLGKEEAPELVRKIKRNQKAKHRWMRTKVLIIDEVSMVDADLFDKLEAVARQLRNNGRPFGGMQLVITGDFFQLPPVPDGGKQAKFAFDAATWNTTIEHTIGLHHVFRQKDPVFAGMLNEMREGRLSEASIRAFRSLDRECSFTDAITGTELFPTRAEVERANNERLGQLQGKVHIFEARDGGAIADKAQRDKLLQNVMAPDIISLKKGAQVMLIKNVDENLVNGSLGQVMGFMSEQTFDRYTTHEDEFVSTPGGTLEEGQERGGVVHSLGISTSKELPVVRFNMSDGTSRDLLCQPETWKVELPNGEVQASRSQVPLILAWALSIHKAQGQTLERVKVDLGKVFEKGQAYVALSRATSMAGLQVLRFDPKKVVAHDRVRNFYGNLSRVELAEKNKARLEGGGQKKAKSGVKAEDYEKMFVGDGL